MSWFKHHRVLLSWSASAAMAVCYVSHSLCQEFSTEASLDAGRGRVVNILAKTWSDFGQPMYYEVRVEGQVVVEPCLIDALPEDAKLRLVFAESNNLVAVVESDRPDVVIAIHDFAADETWPRPLGSDSLFDTGSRGRALADRLQAAESHTKYKLSTESFRAGTSPDDRNLTTR